MIVGSPTILNLVPGGVMKCVHVNQVNKNIEIQFKVMNGAAPYNVPEGVTCTIRGTKGDAFGYAAEAAVTAGSNVITVTLTEQLTAVAGAGNIFELVFVGAADDMKASTENFILAVERQAMGEDTVISDSDLSYAEQVLDQLQNVAAVNAQVQQNKSNLAAEISRAKAAEAAETAARQAADNTLQSNINAEASTRAAQDASLQSQINQLVAPEGSAPSAAEVENARVGADGTVYPTLGDAIRTQDTQLKSQLEACEAGTSILVEVGYFTNAQKAADSTVGYGTAKYAGNTLKLTYNRSNATSTVGVNLNDHGMPPDANKVLLDDYPYVVFSCKSNIPANVNLTARFWVYVGTTTSYRVVEIPLTDRVGNKVILDLKKYVTDLGYANNNNAYLRGVFSDSFTYTSVSLDFKFFGFFTAKQGETYNLALKYENLETRLSSAEEITEKAVTAIGEINLADETKIVFAQLDSSGAESAASAQYQQISTDFIPVDVGVLYTLQLWAKDDSEGFWARVCFYNSNKVYVSRNDIRAASGTDRGYQYYINALTIESGVAYVRISLTTYGDGKFKLERGNAVSDWTPGLGSVVNGQVWNDVLAHSIVGVIHRGCGEDQTAPENTIPGFIWGKNAGFDFCETDIRYTSDGVAVLLHDASINRTARNADGTEISETVNIADITYAQALTYDFGIYKGTEYAGTKIPTLEEFIVLCKNIELHPYLELKAFQNAATNIPDILSMLDGYGMLNHVSWTASAYGWLFNIRRLYPHADLSLLTDATYFDRAVAVLNALKTPSNSVAMSIINAELTAERIQTLKDNGILISAYCPNTVSAMLAVDESVTIVTSDKLNYETVRKDSILGTQ